MKIGIPSRLLLGGASAFLLIGGVNEIGLIDINDNIPGQIRVTTVNARSQGIWKISAGLSLLAIALTDLKMGEWTDPDDVNE
tara:strand:+ start:123 stop:368 length:246 start_codon:yes stop_codon:yes gene_type:complete